MIRALALALLLLAGAARAEPALRHDPDAPLLAAAAARGAVVWLHPFYRSGEPDAPPGWVLAMAEAGWDVWRFERPPASDSRPGTVEALAAATRALRAAGFRQVALVGESRGAFLILEALRMPGLADSALLGAPAAHGTRPERRPEALADFARHLAAASPDAVRRLALALFEDDAWDPSPEARAALFREATRRLGLAAWLLDRPAAPVGHGGLTDPMFAARYAGCASGFLDVTQPAPSC